ncbi:hypothetical protein D9753_15145 [Streptomyces dangxiongensis]|uniref:Uncharacterized protein n=1 Tax=Streptomyces dangxiongensis TaxID=1442032 RepID=A0A3G2JR24_9ACTN|nr:hypothetical protein D9753_15145 [Streptomyces dangxiongensis]
MVLAPSSAAPAPEADLALHGSAVLDADRVDLLLTPRNEGPGAVTDATVRLRWSVPLAGRQEPPAGCLRADERTVLCATGALAAEATGEQLHVPVRLVELPGEVTLDIDTVWIGSAVDANPSNDRSTVLVLATGDSYAF